MHQRKHTWRRLAVHALLALGITLGAISVASPAQADSVLCSGGSFSACLDAGYTAHGYENHYTQSHWGAFSGHNCTNYAAYTLSSRGAPYRGLMGNANEWDDTAASQGYVVDQNPAVGAVAQWESNAGGAGSAGHVAIVESWDGSTLIVSEDNFPSGPFRWRAISAGSSAWPSHFLHIRDVAAPPPSSGALDLRQFYVANGQWTAFDVSAATGVRIAGNPAPIGGSAFARSTDSHLYQFYVNNGWTAFDVSKATGVNIAGDPSPVGGAAFGRDPQGNLRQFYVANGQWTAFNVSAATGVKIAGNPAAIGTSVFARDTSGNLRQFYVTNGNWAAANISGASGVKIASDPSPEGKGVFARDTSGHLRQFYVTNGQWIAFDISGATGVGVTGNPAANPGGGAWARDTNGNLRQFYVTSGQWAAFNVSAATGVTIAGNPAPVGGAVFARDTNNHLRQFYVAGSWIAFDVTGATGVSIAGDPAPIGHSVFAAGR